MSEPARRPPAGTERRPDPDTVAVFNGIDFHLGSYLTPPLPRREALDRVGAWVAARGRDLIEVPKQVPIPTDPADAGTSGWGVILPAVAPPADLQRLEAALEALGPLLDLRRRQVEAATGTRRRFRIFAGDDGYRPGETKADFLARHGLAPGTTDPERVPHYLLILGGPERVPMSFQYQLDVSYAVGRIAFDDVESYARYARSVVAAEEGRVIRPRRVSFLAVENPDDRATARSAEDLVSPLAHALAASPRSAGWQVELDRGPAATKRRALELLGGDGEKAPAIVFTASHGIALDPDDARQRERQGALLCQDWPGPEAWQGELAPEHYLAASDVADDHDCAGQIAFVFACYGGGTPAEDGFPLARRHGDGPPAWASFVAALPQRLLAHPRGGALAVVAHVDRAWTCSFDWRDAPGRQIGAFEEVLARLVERRPVGWALEPFGRRYAEIAAQLSDEELERYYQRSPDPGRLASWWTAAVDARNYVVLGDPAVRAVV